MVAIDQRIVRVSININGQLKVFDGLAVKSTGTKFANPLQNEATLEIANLTKADRNYILTETSPFNKNRTPKLVILEAGRVSTGYTQVFSANISSSTVTQPPDIWLKLKIQANQFLKGKIVASAQAGSVPLSRICSGIARDLGLQLVFQATDKNISNYQFSGGAYKQVEAVSALATVDAYVEDNQFIVKDLNVPLAGQQRVLSMKSGMIGTPEPTELGIKVTYLLDNQSKIGGGLEIQSELNPQFAGNYTIFKLGWNITSRDVPFYWIAECKRIDAAGNVVIPTGIKKRKKK